MNITKVWCNMTADQSQSIIIIVWKRHQISVFVTTKQIGYPRAETLAALCVVLKTGIECINFGMFCISSCPIHSSSFPDVVFSDEIFHFMNFSSLFSKKKRKIWNSALNKLCSMLIIYDDYCTQNILWPNIVLLNQQNNSFFYHLIFSDILTCAGRTKKL